MPTVIPPSSLTCAIQSTDDGGQQSQCPQSNCQKHTEGGAQQSRWGRISLVGQAHGGKDKVVHPHTSNGQGCHMEQVSWEGEGVRREKSLIQ